MMSISQDDISIELTHENDERGDYNAFRVINAKIKVSGSGQDEGAGHIVAVVIDRQKIPNGMFLSAMDEHSGDLQKVAVNFFESKLGRTRIRLLSEGEDRRYPIMYIEEVHVDERYRIKDSSDVGTYALNKLLHHPYVTGRNCCMCIYILDGFEMMEPQLRKKVRYDREMSDKERKQLLKPYQRTDANQFLRNGFYQDSTVATLGAHYIVAAKSHWEAPLKSHDEVSSVQFYVPPPMPEPPCGKDAEILELTKTTCSHLRFPRMNQPSLQDLTQRVDSMAALLAEATRPGVDANIILQRIQQAQRLIQDAQPASSTSYRQQVERLIQEGGDLSRSSALHASVAYDNCDIVSCILELDRSTVNSRDFNDVTPLMIAAESMAGKKTNTGYPNDHAIIDLLVENGADKHETNRQGLTAYGMFVKLQMTMVT
eukprot:scaffold12494_cov55-Cyclotella_meneghiniana.AAC.2